MEGPKKHVVAGLNAVLTCRLCEGYLIDATTLVECLHTFCRGCILRYFENSKTQCPTCSMVYKKKTQCFRSDTQIQAIVYKLIPSLFVKEIQRKEDFYRSTGVRAGSSCSDDSVIDRERDMILETEEMISQCVGDKTLYFSPEDSISLSLEYYQPHLDTTDISGDKKAKNLDTVAQQTNITNENIDTITTSISSADDTSGSKEKNDSDQVNNKNNGQISTDKISDKVKRVCDKRYLQCPAGVNMKHLQKFVRMKYGLTGDHRVDIIHKGEVLPNDFSLMDVAYSFKWEKKNPMRFFYRIFKPMKIRPIKIVNTTLSTGGKQLQIVPVTTSNHPVANNTHHNSELSTSMSKSPKVEKIPEKKETAYPREETESEQQDKEILLAHLQLQSKSKALQNAEAKKVQVPEKVVKECIFEYEEPDQEEIKRFAERRDREWALQKKLEEEIRPERDEYYSREHYSSKKRKKSKHSKNDSNGHKEKKRKLHADKIHAEITNNDKTDLKLKVKITTNGHKHKHHKIESIDKSELSHKEKLLQMRQVRHKHLSGSSDEMVRDEKSQPAIPTLKVPKVYVSDRPKEASKYLSGEPESKRKRESPKPTDVSSRSIPENNNKPIESHPKPRIEPVVIKSMPSLLDSNRPNLSLSRPRPDFPAAKIAKTEATPRVPTVQLERHEPKERNAQKTFLKTTAVNSDRHSKDSKIGQGKVEGVKTPGLMGTTKVLPIGSITTNNRSLDRKIASLQQRCTIEPKNLSNSRTDNGKIEKKVNFGSDKSKVITPQYPPGFTVSKIENSATRKVDSSDTVPDNRPSLEITLIPPTSTTPPKPTEPKQPAKRPPPGTIPLERIKNAVNLKSGISIIPKIPERTDNIGVLDLSKPNKTPENSPRSPAKNEPINGLNSMVNRQINCSTPRPANSPSRGTPENKNAQLSNLKMLSTVALEHQNKTTANSLSKPRPQIPSLQTISRMPSMQQLSNSIRGPGLQRLPPKLNEIQKFRPTNPQIRNLRPNQNQNIRNIPNPSLLMNRQQQNQSRLISNSTSVQTSTTDKKESSPKPTAPVTSTTGTTTKELPLIKSGILEQKVSEKQEISV